MNTFKNHQKGSSKIWGILLLVLIFVLVFGGALALKHFKGNKLGSRDLQSAEKILGIEFTPQERKMMLAGLARAQRNYQSLRSYSIPNHVPPAVLFNPIPPGKAFSIEEHPFIFEPDPDIRVPDDREGLAFYPVTALASLLQTGKITSVELTNLYLDRLKRYGGRLECVVTLTEELALRQARRADEELARGIIRSPLHGIPWGAKDLLAVKGYPTTWGAMPYKDQQIDLDATVVRRLDEAGAVLVAKLTLGALAMGDVWFGGKTRSPWHPENGSSGSSAGPAAATAAGLVGFSIGTETLGSIVSPSTRNAVTGLRPTYGRVSRYGAMALSWTMDKVGPICRTVEGCALVFDAILGPDCRDLTLADVPFNWDPDLDIRSIRVGYIKEDFDRSHRGKEHHDKALEVLQSLGVDLVPFELPKISTSAMRFILSAEAAAAFDELTRSNRDDLLVRQNRGAWPNSFRQARLIPAVEYIQANRLRTMYMAEMAEKMKDIDVFVVPSFGASLTASNLTGHPTVVLPCGPPDEESPTSLSFISDLFEEAKALRLAKAYQDRTDFHRIHPDLEKTLASVNE
jgi:Asp-tRNA(Asn)/Glu-tRNA(Gln) amidotransferase A subunit family amidase